MSGGVRKKYASVLGISTRDNFYAWTPKVTRGFSSKVTTTLSLYFVFRKYEFISISCMVRTGRYFYE